MLSFFYRQACVRKTRVHVCLRCQVYSLLLLLSLQIWFDKFVFVLERLCLNDIWWLAYLSFNFVSLIPSNLSLPQMAWINVMFTRTIFSFFNISLRGNITLYWGICKNFCQECPNCNMLITKTYSNIISKIEKHI